MSLFAPANLALNSTLLASAAGTAFMDHLLNPPDVTAAWDPTQLRHVTAHSGASGGGGNRSSDTTTRRVRKILTQWPSKRSLAELRWMNESVALEALRSIIGDTRATAELRVQAASAHLAVGGLMEGHHLLEILAEVRGEQSIKHVMATQCDEQAGSPTEMSHDARWATYVVATDLLIGAGLRMLKNAVHKLPPGKERESLLSVLHIENLLHRSIEALWAFREMGPPPEGKAREHEAIKFMQATVRSGSHMKDEERDTIAKLLEPFRGLPANQMRRIFQTWANLFDHLRDNE